MEWHGREAKEAQYFLYKSYTLYYKNERGIKFEFRQNEKWNANNKFCFTKYANCDARLVVCFWWTREEWLCRVCSCILFLINVNRSIEITVETKQFAMQREEKLKWFSCVQRCTVALVAWRISTTSAFEWTHYFVDLVISRPEYWFGFKFQKNGLNQQKTTHLK